MKVLFNKKENALVQMADGSQAQLGKGWPGRVGLWVVPRALRSRTLSPPAPPSHEPPQWAQAARKASAHHTL